MSASNLLQSVLKPRNFSSSPRRHVCSPKKNRKALGKSFTASENVVPTGRSILKNTLPATPQICLCSPTNHPGSFRCRLHRALKAPPGLAAITPATIGQPKHVVSAEGSLISSPSTKVRSVDEVATKRAVAFPLDAPNCEARSKFERRPSRLCRVVMATDPEMGAVSATHHVTTLIPDKKPLVIINMANELLPDA